MRTVPKVASARRLTLGVAVALAGLFFLPALTSAEELACTTDNLLAHQQLVENASATLDNCNRAVVATGRWSRCELPAEIPQKMPWINECLSERLAANLARLDSLRDPRASEVTELSTEASRLDEMGNALSLYFGLIRANIGLEVDALKRTHSGPSE